MYEEDLLCLGLALTSLLKASHILKEVLLLEAIQGFYPSLGFFLSRPEVADASLAIVMDFRTKVFKNFSLVSTLLLKSCWRH